MQKDLKSRQEKYASENPQALKLTAAMDGQSAQRASLKEKLEVFKVKAAGSEKQEPHKEKGKEVTM